jgi:hypothetical protein
MLNPHHKSFVDKWFASLSTRRADRGGEKSRVELCNAMLRKILR